MIDEATLDTLIGRLYEAGSGAAAWSDALAEVSLAFRARAAVVQHVDLSTGQVAQLVWGGYSMQAPFMDYLRHWHALDPRRSYLIAHAPEVLGRVWQCGEEFDDTFASRDAFHRHFLPAHGTRHLACKLHLSGPSTLSAFALELPAPRGPLDADESWAMARLARHFEEALRQESRLRHIIGQALAGHRLLDGLVQPLWLVDGDRFIFHANAAARDSPAQTRAGRWHWSDGTLDRRIGEALQGLLAQPHGSRRRVALRRQRGARPCWLLLQTLQPGRVLGTFGERPVLLLLLVDPERLVSLDAFALAEAFGLTPAQARVAVLLADGHDGPEIAAALGCALPTIRSHVRKVLLRLGTRRTADAVRLLRQGEALWTRLDAMPEAAG